MNLPLTIKQTQEGLLRREYSCVDLVDAYLARIDRFDKEINSFITVTTDQAYEDAKSADKLIKSLGKDSTKEYPLLGVTVAHKDMYLTKGIRTTAASKVLDEYIPQYSATSAIRLKKAGTILIGKANQDAWAHGSSGENSDYGSTLNPWNKSYVPGGSSSGSAAAMAADFTLIATGTDTCGSIRLPANFCGMYGLKPTYGSVSRYGVIAMASSLDSIGHFGRTVEDIKRIYQITKGPDGFDATVTPSDFKRNRKGEFVLGIPKEYLETGGLSQSVKKEVKRVIEVFDSIGIKTKEVSLPHTKYAISVYYIIQPAEVSSNLGRYTGLRYGNNRDFFGQEARRRIMLGSYVLSSGYYDAYYLKAMQVRSILVSEVDKVFDDVDALIAPVAPTTAFKMGERVDDPLKMYLTDVYAATANLTGIPALAVPTKLAHEDMTLGFQLMGPRFSEDMLFEIARKFEKFTNYKPMMPKL